MMMMRTTAARIEPRAREYRERATHQLIPAASVHALAALFLALLLALAARVRMLQRGVFTNH